MSQKVASSTPEELGVLIKAVQTVLHQRMDEVLRPMGLTVSQYACLQNLHDTPQISSSDLARRTFVSRQSMNVLLRGLERQGLVERAGGPGPRRELGAVLTAEAERLLKRAEVAVAGVAERMAATLVPGDRDELVRMLSACRDALLSPSGLLRPSSESR